MDGEPTSRRSAPGARGRRGPREPGVAPTRAVLHEAALAYLARGAATADSVKKTLERRISNWARRSVRAGRDAEGVASDAAKARELVPEIVGRLREVGLVNDSSFAENRAKRMSSAGRSRRAIAAHLARFDPPMGAEGGIAVRRQVLGEAHVARAQANVTPLDAAFQDWITANVWGGVWTRPGLTRHTRSMLTLAMMATLGRHEEFELHVRATRNTGVTPDEIAEILLQVGAYAGVPAANSALKIAKRILSEDDA